MRFCTPALLFAYLNLRKKQVQNIENPSNDEVKQGEQPISVNASGMELEREDENEVQPMNKMNNVAYERESETMIEGSSQVPEDELKDLISYWNSSPAKKQELMISIPKMKWLRSLNMVDFQGSLERA
ncbi:Phosphomethylpyrimidine synthase [Bienertia sinuspersici]